MKKIFLLSIIMLLLTGCTSINSLNIKQIVNNGFNSKIKINNTNRKGYSYYLPRGLKLKSSDNYNEVLENNKYTYYLYVDILSYHNKTSFDYQKNENAYYSEKLDLGYIEINKYKNEQYLVEIMYNYAKIEVIVDKNDLNNTVAYAIAILSSITYNDSIINNYLESKEYKSVVEDFNIFEVVGSDKYLGFTEDEDTDGIIKDPDYVR